MMHSQTAVAARHLQQEIETNHRTIFGFWLYLMTDCVLFGCLFAAYAVLHPNTFGGPSSRDIFSLPYALIETMILLTSSFTCGLAMLFAHRQEKNGVMVLFLITFILGASFLGMELTEFHHLVSEGYSWQESGFLSAFYTLVSTHGAHISVGLLWIVVMLFQVAFRGLTLESMRRLTCLSLFWHFLDIVWIFIFTIVYLMGVL